jgi:hypothetical protein
MKFMKHPFGLGYKDPVEEHIQEPFRKHIKEPVKKGIKKLEKEDPLHLKSVNRSKYPRLIEKMLALSAYLHCNLVFVKKRLCSIRNDPHGRGSLS